MISQILKDNTESKILSLSFNIQRVTTIQHENRYNFGRGKILAIFQANSLGQNFCRIFTNDF